MFRDYHMYCIYFTLFRLGPNVIFLIVKFYLITSQGTREYVSVSSVTSPTGAIVPQCFFSPSKLGWPLVVSGAQCWKKGGHEKRLEFYTWGMKTNWKTLTFKAILLELNRCEHHSDSWASVALRVEWSSSDQWFSPKPLLSIYWSILGQETES